MSKIRCRNAKDFAFFELLGERHGYYMILIKDATKIKITFSINSNLIIKKS